MHTCKNLSVAISPCPNDTYIFGAWILGIIPDLEGCRSRFYWQEVDVLNRWAGQARVLVIKVSAALALDLEKSYYILSSGGAFGVEHGPKLIARKDAGSRPARIAVPGMQTTAYALLRAALDYEFQPVPMPFDCIVDSLNKKEAEAGLLIHETALVYRTYGMDLILDLGRWWQENTLGLPLPLGCIALHKSLGEDMASVVQDQIRESLRAADGNKSRLSPLMSHLAQEVEPEIMDRHVQAYVNDYSLDMGRTGRKALQALKEIKQGA